MSELEKEPRPSDRFDDPKILERATWFSVIPFVAWIFLMGVLDFPAIPKHWQYTIRTLICLGLVLYMKPWQWYGPLKFKNLPLALGVGFLVFVVWVALETPWVKTHMPGLYGFYTKYLVGIWPPFQPMEPVEETPYAPSVCGWSFSLIRLAGSAFVIAIIEEFFWRGFLYRWVMGLNFLKIELSRFDPKAFLIVAVFFGVEHQRFVAGFIAGLAYCWIMIKTEDIWAASISHVFTNLILGVYVLAFDQYEFW